MTSLSLRMAIKSLNRGHFRWGQVAYISTIAKMTPEERAERAQIVPWPYKEKGWNSWHAIWDDTVHRFHENTKVISIEGPPACGKNALGRALAKDFGMEFFPMVTMDRCYKNSYGYDLRDYKHLIQYEDAKTFDENDFIKNPKDPKATRMQCQLLMERIEGYIDVLCHVMNTGQGAVCVKNMYTDRVFAEAMHKVGYMNTHALNNAYYYYKKMLDFSNPNDMKELCRPHLIIYLDVPPEKVYENLRARGKGEEKAYTLDFLKALDEDYKKNVLPSLESHCEMLVYDWSDGGDPEVIVEDIERIDFEKYTFPHDPKLKDWRFFFNRDLQEKRWKYTSGRHTILMELNNFPYNVPEIPMHKDSFAQYMDVYYSVPGNKYLPGYNAEQGDKGVMWKWLNRNLYSKSYSI